MRGLGARLFAIWETTPFNGHWPQVTIIWEIDGFADYARIGSALARDGSHEAAHAKWSTFMAEIGAAGEGRIMYPGPSNKTLAQLQEANFTAGLVIQEIMQTKPGRQDDYIRELERLYVPWSERTGKRWLGSFTTTFRYNEVIHYWALEGGWYVLRRALPVVAGEPAGRDCHLDERGAGAARRLGRLDSTGPTTIATAVNTALHQHFSYDPFDPAVMADPLPYYRVLREHHPLYYIPKWDAFALSRFSDIWQMLEVNDGTFVASEGTLPAATVLAHHNHGPVPDPPVHPMPFHAMFDAPLYDSIRRAHGKPLRPKSVAMLQARIRKLANDRLDVLLPRGTFDLTQEYGGIVAASVVCELLGLPVDLAPEVLATVNAGSLPQPGTGVDTAQARPGYLEYLVPVVKQRRADSPGSLPIVDGLIGYRLPDGSAFDDVEAATQLLGIFIGGTETVPKIVAHGLWELSRLPDQLASVRADPAANVAIARNEMIRYCASGAMVCANRTQALHHPRHHDAAGPADHHAAGVGQPR